MPIHVNDEGSLDARLVLIGEAPGKHEEIHGRPFVGPSGGRLAVWWRQVGLQRSDFYITNVLPYRPDSIDRVSRDEMDNFILALHERLAALRNPIVIVPTGNYALYALTGKGRVFWNKKDGRVVRPGILDWRGSILSYEQHQTKRRIHVVPTIHPAAVLRQPSLERRALADWTRIAQGVNSLGRLITPTCHHKIKPTVEDVEAYVDTALSAGIPLSLDIETPKGRVTEYQMLDGSWKRNVRKEDAALVAKYKSGKKKGELKKRTKAGRAYLGCIGFAIHTRYSITVPLTLDYWKDPLKLVVVKSHVNRLLASTLDKVVQNGVSFDLPWLFHEGYTVAGRVWDTRAMHHALDPRDDHDLAYMASVYTNFPFWKHEAKDPEEISKYATNSEALWTYCGIDVCSTLEIFYVLKQKLADQDLIDFYHRHYTELIPALLAMGSHGLNVDTERRRAEADELDRLAGKLNGEIEDAAGLPLVARKGLSNDRLKFLFYGTRGFEGERAQSSFRKLGDQFPGVESFNLAPIRKKNGKGGRSVTCDEIAIRRLVLKYPNKLGNLGPMLLTYRRNRKMRDFLGTRLDEDGRMRCAYGFVTEAGRLQSQGTPWGTGANLQNQDRQLRYIYLPDEDAQP